MHTPLPWATDKKNSLTLLTPFSSLSFLFVLQVASPSCHDVLPLRAWWEQDKERARRLWSRDFANAWEVEKEDGERFPPEKCEPFVAKAILEAHLATQSCLMIAPLQDWLALSPLYNKRNPSEERINDPTNSKHYWCYRSHVLLEDLKEDANFKKEIRQMIRESGRI